MIQPYILELVESIGKCMVMMYKNGCHVVSASAVYWTSMLTIEQDIYKQ